MFDQIPKKIQLDGLPFPIDIIRSAKRKKTIGFEVYPNQVVIRVPTSLKRSAFLDLMEKRKSWILLKWREVRGKPQGSGKTPPSRPRSSLPGDILFYGQKMPVCQSEGAALNRFQLRVDQTAFTILTPLNQVPDADSQVLMHGLVVNFLKRTARKDFIGRLQKWHSVMHVNYREFRLKDQKTRWGSCSSLGNINLNWRLIQAPGWVIDYVVIHELAHLRELNHSAAFWTIVEHHCPNYTEAKDWLKKHGHELHVW